jgi:hypothetical protein
MHHVVVDTSADGTFYAAGNYFSVVVAAGTVGGKSAVGYVVGSFSLGAPASTDAASIRSALGIGSANIDSQLGTIGSKLDTIDDYVDTEVAAIKAKTDNLPSDPADASDIAGAFTALQSHGDSNWAGGGSAPSASDNAAAVWAAAARTLTALDEDSTTLDLDATIRAALGMAAADLDTQLDAIDTKTTNLPSDPADASVVAGLISALQSHGDSTWGTATGFASSSDMATALSDLSAIKDITDLLTNLTFTVPAMGRGTAAASGSSTTAVATSAFSIDPDAPDQFKGRIVLFDSDTTTTALRGVAVMITATTNSSTPTFTVDPMPTTPADGDTFSVI